MAKKKNWYVLKVTYQREMKVKYELDKLHIESFIPMKIKFRMKGERRVKELRPAIHNLIFVHTYESQLTKYKEETAIPVNYIYDKETRKPIIIPERQMANFIGVAGSHDEQLIYLDPNPGVWKKGTKVRITGGVFKGYEGTFLRIKGDRRLVVEIPGLIAVATGFIHPSLVEAIE